MKKTFSTSMIILIVATLVFTGCNKIPKENHFAIGNETVAVDTLELEYSGIEGTQYGFWVDLLSPEVTLTEDGYWRNSGKILDFYLISESSDGVASGTYQYYKSESAILIFTRSEYCLSWEYEGTNSWVDITSGSLKVKRDGNNYEITFKGEDSAGHYVEAYYKGAAAYYDMSSKASAAKK